MAQKNILNQVKTADGYDTLYPLTPYQIHQAKTVTGNGSNYAITIDLPAENVTVPIIVSFTPNVANLANCTISVNGLASKPLYVNNTVALAGTIGTTDTCLIKYDINADSSTILACSGKLFTSVESAYMVPKGLICMWSGSTVPNGWLLCNGQNGTPDLRNRFIVGSGSTYAIGNTGGSDKVTLTTEQLPSHTHSCSNTTIEWSGTVRNNNSVLGDFIPCPTDSGPSNEVTYDIGSHSHTIGNTGSGSAHENRPPYYALAFIMKG